MIFGAGAILLAVADLKENARLAGRRAARRRGRRRRDRRRSRGRRRREREPRRAGCVRGRPLRAGRADPPLVLRGCRAGLGRSGHRQGHAAPVYGWIRPGTRRQPARARRPVHRRRRPGDRRSAVRGVRLRRVGTTARGDLHGLRPAHDGRAARDRVARVRVPGARQPAGRQGRRQCRDHLHARGRRERRRRRARPRRRAARLAPAARERGAGADPRRRDSGLDEASALRVHSSRVARPRTRRAGRARSGRQGARRRAEPDSPDGLQARSPLAPRRRERAVASSATSAPAKPGSRSAARRDPPSWRPRPPAWPRTGMPLRRRCPWSATCRSARAARSAVRSPTQTRPRSCRSWRARSTP